MPRAVPQSAYEILGVTPQDDFSTIKRAYRAQVRAHHPDIAGGDPVQQAEKLRAINEAWDAMRHHHPQEPQAAWRKAALHRDQRRRAEAARAEVQRRATGARPRPDTTGTVPLPTLRTPLAAGFDAAQRVMQGATRPRLARWV